jgi:hypothetical protein
MQVTTNRKNLIKNPAQQTYAQIFKFTIYFLCIKNAQNSEILWFITLHGVPTSF